MLLKGRQNTFFFIAMLLYLYVLEEYILISVSLQGLSFVIILNLFLLSHPPNFGLQITITIIINKIFHLKLSIYVR